MAKENKVYETNELDIRLGFRMQMKNGVLFITNKCVGHQFILGKEEQEILKKVLKCRKG